MSQNPQAYEQSSILLEKVINETVQKSTNEIVSFMLSLDDKKKIYENLICEIISELERASFMTMNLELSEKQKEVLRASSSNIVHRAYDNYKATIIKSKREDTHIERLEENIKTIVETSIVAVGEEINRGAVVPSAVAKCDISNPDKKKIELHYAGDTRITVPTNGFFVSSNCVQVLKDSVLYIKEEVKGSELPPVDSNGEQIQDVEQNISVN